MQSKSVRAALLCSQLTWLASIFQATALPAFIKGGKYQGNPMCWGQKHPQLLHSLLVMLGHRLLQHLCWDLLKVKSHRCATFKAAEAHLPHSCCVSFRRELRKGTSLSSKADLCNTPQPPPGGISHVKSLWKLFFRSTFAEGLIGVSASHHCQVCFSQRPAVEDLSD